MLADAAPESVLPPSTPLPSTSPAPRRRHAVRRLFIVAIAAVAAAYMAICAAIYVWQDRLIYFPSRGYASAPRDIGLPFDDLTLTTADGIKIAAWYVPAAAARATAIYCHGNAEKMDELPGTLTALHRLGLSVLLFDYRGYGRSAGEPSEAGTYADAEAAWRYLVDERGVPPQRIILVGRSLGGGVAIELAARHTPGALVVESSFASLVEVGQREYPYLPVSWLCRERYESIRKVGRIACPKLFFHGVRDELIPIESGRRLFAAAAEPKELVETDGGHNDGGFEYSAAATRRLGEWLGQVLARP